MTSFPPPTEPAVDDDGGEHDSDWYPNYRRRRLVAGIVGLVLLTGIGTVVWAAVRPEKSTSAREERAALARIVAGKLELLDDKGAVATTIQVGTTFQPLAGGPVGYLVDRALSTDGTLAYVDLKAKKATSIRPGTLAAGSAVVKPFGTTSVEVVDDTVGQAIVVDLAAGKKIDVRQVAGRPSAQVFDPGIRATPGRHVFGYYDGKDTGAVVMSTTDPNEAWQVDGLVLDEVDTASLAVPRADLSAGATPHLAVFDKGKQTTRTATLGTVPAGAVLRADGSSALVLAKDGTMQIVTLDGSSTPTAAGSIGFVPTTVFRIASDRVFAAGDGGSALVDLAGKVIRSWPPAASGAVVPFRSGSACGIFQPSYRVVVQGNANAQMIDLSTGGILATFDNSAASVSDDGCTAATIGGALQIVVGGKAVEVADASKAELMALDAAGTRAVVARASGSDRALALIDLASGIEAQLSAGSYLFLPITPKASTTTTTKPTATTKPTSTTRVVSTTSTSEATSSSAEATEPATSTTPTTEATTVPPTTVADTIAP